MRSSTRLVGACIWGMLAACAAERPPVRDAHDAARSPPPKAEAEPAHEAWRKRALDEDCRVQLGALIEGRLDAFSGLPHCGRVDAEAAFGGSGDEPSRFEQLGEYRVYPRPGGGRVMVWFAADDLRVLQLVYPRLPRTLDAQLGPPEGKAPSGLSAEWEQWIYARRGLTAHVRRGSREVVALFAYRPTTVEAFLSTDIAKVAKRQDPVEELK